MDQWDALMKGKEVEWLPAAPPEIPAKSLSFAFSELAATRETRLDSDWPHRAENNT